MVRAKQLAVHRTILAVDVEGFGHQQRTNRDQVAIRDGLYGALRDAFRQAGIPWRDRDHEDRGDGMFSLIGPEVPKSLFAESFPAALVAALQRHNSTHSGLEQIRLRMALHAGEVTYDQHGATAASINLAFRLLESGPVKQALARSPGVLAIIASSWFFEEVIRHCPDHAAGYAPVPVEVKETATTGWICLPDQPGPDRRPRPDRPAPGPPPAVRPAESRQAGKTREALSRVYRSALAEPITPSGEMPVGLEMPTLGDGYVDHRIRIAEITSSADPGRDSWWADKPDGDSACDFILASLASPRALTAPLVLLGQPGSGKSVLTRILAARLSVAGFLPVRVELRKVAAEADLQDQIESAIRGATGEYVRWPDVTESGRQVLPVVIFDGFDELLQATGISQSDFLLRVQEFQGREARLGRPLAVIVTSRTVVSDRARFPQGAAVIRLEPFDQDQVAAWLEVWAATNRASLSARGMSPLPMGTALRYGELAEQPILLLMLALYDADANALQSHSATLGQTELYGRLLRDFADREIRKNSPALAADDLERAVEAELLRLSIVALAMFNRRSQWVLEADLEADFSALRIDGEPSRSRSASSRADLTAAQLTVGRFFFVHEARASRGGRHLRTYEFLHATFGEYLVASLVINLLVGLLEPEPVPASPGGTPGDLMFALLSYAALTARGPVVAFLGDLFDHMSEDQRKAIAEKVLQLHRLASFRPDEAVYRAYEPLALPAVNRNAAWTANLVVIAVLAAGEVSGRDLYPAQPEVQYAWRADALIWRSQLAGYGWEGLHQALAFSRVWDGQQKEFRLSRASGESGPKELDMAWTFNMPPGSGARRPVFSSPSHSSLMALRKINFASNMSEDIMAHGLAPLVSVFPETAHVLITVADGRTISAVHALISAFAAPYQADPPRESVYRDLAEVAGRLMATSHSAQDSAYLKMALGVLVSAVDGGLVSPAALAGTAAFDGNLTTGDPELRELLGRLVSGP